MATLHFICGKAASGKTTLARSLAVQHAAAVSCEDEWLTLLDARLTMPRLDALPSAKRKHRRDNDDTAPAIQLAN